ncbi:leucine-rich repeat-containing protein let-4-like [Chelonus insularis]|uniref:leucine-rich repeat-containing protein let-4-like n=1 Tax=Chelonus insularis TaxID=460826 RepID=UPI00158F429F|nr:leucine-rich repeat-containing protein let-4-like [Chelonus insularis]
MKALTVLLLTFFILLASKKGLTYSKPRVTFPLRYVDHSINIRSSMSEEISLPTGKCEDMRDRDLSLNLPGVAPRSLYPGFIDSYRVSCLSIPDSFIDDVAVGSFDCLPNLLYLDMSRNRIEFCDFLAFGGHDKLRSLVLDENNSPGHEANLILSRIDYFPRLEHLYLRKNQLEDITTSLRQCFPSLTHLYLSDNRLEGRTFDYLELPYTLTHLHLERNWIRRLDSRGLINLSSLFLDGNRIQSICHWQCHGTAYLNLRGTNRLQFLSVSRNEIAYIECDSFEDSRYLKSLNLAHNRIDTISPGTFDVLQELRDLSLSYNRLTSLPDFRSVRMLTSLSLDHNLLHSVPSGIFCNLHHLKWLSLGGNRIRNIDVNAFVDLPSLEELDLSNNELSYLPSGWIDSNTCLQHLDIRGNHFSSIESLSIHNVRSLTHLYLQGNPLSHLDTPAYWRLSYNVSVYLDYTSSVYREPCYVRCDRMHREYVIPRLTFGDEWTW